MSLTQVIVFLSYCSPLILLLGIVISAIYLKSNANIYKLIGLYLVISLIMDISSRYLGMVSSVKSNLFLIPAFSFLELMIFLVLYGQFLIKGHGILLKIIAVIALIVLSIELYYIDLYDYKSFQSYGKVLDSLLIISFGLLYFWKLVKSGEMLNKDTVMLNSVVLFYFSITLLIYLPINFLVNADLQITYYFWIFNMLLTLAFHAFLIHLIWKNGKTHKLLPYG